MRTPRQRMHWDRHLQRCTVPLQCMEGMHTEGPSWSLTLMNEALVNGECHTLPHHRRSEPPLQPPLPNLILQHHQNIKILACMELLH